MQNVEHGRGRFTFSYQPEVEISDTKFEPGSPLLGPKSGSAGFAGPETNLLASCWAQHVMSSAKGKLPGLEMTDLS